MCLLVEVSNLQRWKFSSLRFNVAFGSQEWGSPSIFNLFMLSSGIEASIKKASF